MGWVGCSIVISSLLLMGCHSSPRTHVESKDTIQVVADQDSEIVIENQAFERVFVSARDVLVDYRFGINRVDASRGVLTSHPKRSVGVVSPWDREQTTMEQEWEDFANQQERVVRIEFERSSAEAGAEFESSGEESVLVRVAVLVHRVHRPHWRIESESVRLSTHARSRNHAGQVEAESFRETIGRDVELEERIMAEIRSRVALSDG